MNLEIVILIPAYNPDEKLIKVLEELKSNNFLNIVVVNDGSKADSIWSTIEKYAIVLEHDENKGKGRALKTGFSYCLDKFRDKIGVITIDCDGQHLVSDVIKIYQEMLNNKDSVILGSRNFYDKNVPFTSKMGNLIFRKILKLKIKKEIKDTQTGLRGFPINVLKNLIDIKGNRFEYETNVLIGLVKNKIKISEVLIETVYINNNETSHFNRVKDSIDVLKTIIKK